MKARAILSTILAGDPCTATIRYFRMDAGRLERAGLIASNGVDWIRIVAPKEDRNGK